MWRKLNRIESWDRIGALRVQIEPKHGPMLELYAYLLEVPLTVSPPLNDNLYASLVALGL